MKTAFIIHGTSGHPQENWFPWLKSELEKIGYAAVVPQFPTPENQTLENWFSVFDKNSAGYVESSILIGHSLGGAFALRIIEKYNVTIHAAYFVAAPIGVRPIQNYKGDFPFIGHPFDWELIRSRARKFFIFHSDNDPFVSLGNGELLAEELGTELTFIPNAGHFNSASGYETFPELLEAIKH